MKRRGSGILMHISSLPGPHAVGDLGPSAYRFVDFLSRTGQSYWQVLPLTPTEHIYGNSPYSSPSAFAGNRLYISAESLVKDKLINKKDVRLVSVKPRERADFIKAARFKDAILKKAYQNFLRRPSWRREFDDFCEEHCCWLDDYALFMAVRQRFQNRSWGGWPKTVRLRDPAAIQQLTEKHAGHINRVKFYQFLFYRQWKALKTYANKKSIKIIGDIPIYVNYNSADVWAHPRIFKLNRLGKPRYAAGVPPDYFSRTGQLWGNPVYDWKAMKNNNYRWWARRIGHNLRLYDFIRIDHFRGFAAYWQVPAKNKTAMRGRWVKVPGADFFNVMKKKFGKVPVLAEDIGYITPDVIRLRKRFGFPGTKVLQFAFDGNKRNPYLPENFEENCVVYTGTHDNNTVLGWYRNELGATEKKRVDRYVQRKAKATEIHWAFIELAMHSKARIAIIPMQDFLGLGSEARMNIPATSIGNWSWRLKWPLLNRRLPGKLYRLTTATKRTKR